jgi:hypothetical protein
VTGTTISSFARQVRRGSWITVSARVWWNYEGRWPALGPNLNGMRLEWAPLARPAGVAWPTSCEPCRARRRPVPNRSRFGTGRLLPGGDSDPPLVLEGISAPQRSRGPSPAFDRSS